MCWFGNFAGSLLSGFECVDTDTVLFFFTQGQDVEGKELDQIG